MSLSIISGLVCLTVGINFFNLPGFFNMKKPATNNNVPPIKNRGNNNTIGNPSSNISSSSVNCSPGLTLTSKVGFLVSVPKISVSTPTLKSMSFPMFTVNSFCSNLASIWGISLLFFFSKLSRILSKYNCNV